MSPRNPTESSRSESNSSESAAPSGGSRAAPAEQYSSTAAASSAVASCSPTPGSGGARSQAEKLHETLLLAQATSNLGRRKFISTLLALHDSKLYFQLGSPSIEHYARTHFGIERSVTFEYLRVARSLRDLPRCDQDFRSGKLSWSALREITKVASSETEEEWIAFALKYPGARLKAEVREAVRKNRSTPRKDGYGLPGLVTRLSFELKPEEQDLADKALEKAAEEMGERLQGAEVEAKDAFLFLARRFLQEKLDDEGNAGGPVNPERSLYTILYHICPDCRRAAVPTPDGPVEVDPDVVERVEGDARKVVSEDSEARAGVEEEAHPEKDTAIEPAAASPAATRVDRPNPRSLVRRVHLRDGRACSNPGCDRKQGLHAHHIVERARGGATAIHNEVLLCTTCHALVHSGLLKVEGSPRDRLEWTVPARESSEDFWRRLNELNAAAEVQVLELPRSQSAAVDSRSPEESRAVTSGNAAGWSTAVDSGAGSDTRSSERFQYLVAALRTLGFTATQAKTRLEQAWESFGARVSEASDGDIVKRALRFRAA